jgi:hypothetical protein
MHARTAPMSSAARPELVALWIAEPPERWEALGFAVTDEDPEPERGAL